MKNARRVVAAAALSSSALIAALSVAGDTNYTYDALGRLVKVVRPDGVETNYTLDAAGNRTQVTEGGGAPPPPPPPPPPGPPPAPPDNLWLPNHDRYFQDAADDLLDKAQ